jgi:hypothetical protein
MIALLRNAPLSTPKEARRRQATSREANPASEATEHTAHFRVSKRNAPRSNAQSGNVSASIPHFGLKLRPHPMIPPHLKPILRPKPMTLPHFNLVFVFLAAGWPIFKRKMAALVKF